MEGSRILFQISHDASAQSITAMANHQKAQLAHLSSCAVSHEAAVARPIMKKSIPQMYAYAVQTPNARRMLRASTGDKVTRPSMAPRIANSKTGPQRGANPV